jgi:hypothetical protein
VETADTTNIKRNDVSISNTRDCILDPAGVVPKKDSSSTSNKRYNVPLARTDPTTCATRYNGTCKNIKFVSNSVVKLLRGHN